MYKWIKDRFNLWVALGAAGTSIVLCMLCVVITYYSLAGDSSFEEQEGAIITVIPFPTQTMTSPATPSASQDPHQSDDDSLQVGRMVRVSSTANGGLNLRSAPGVDNPALFLAGVDEIYLILDGPVTADGYAWWNLTSPDQPNHNGWAVGDFLEVVAAP
jgi:hypothetical protein